MTPVGFPHSEISGSTPACDSPKLFAANHVLHRLLMPRHSPCALSSLVTNLPWNPERVPHLRRSLRVAKPRFARVGDVSCPPKALHTTLASRYFLYRDTPSTRSSTVRSSNSEPMNRLASPLTLDCFVQSF